MIGKRLFLLNKDIFFDSHALTQAVHTLRRFSILVDEAQALETFRKAVKPKIGSVHFCTPRSTDNCLRRQLEADVRVLGWTPLEPPACTCEFTKSLQDNAWRQADEPLLQGYREIFLLDTPATVRATREAVFANCAAAVTERVREVLFLDWRPRSPREKVPGSFEVFSDPELLALVGVEAPAKQGSKFSVDSSAVPSNLELQCWGNCVAFEK